MGYKRSYQVQVKQKLKRRKRRQKLAKKGLNPDEVFLGKYFLGSRKS